MKTLADFLGKNASFNSDKIAVISNNRKANYKDLNIKIARLANDLIKLPKLNSRPIIAIILPNNLEFIVSYLAVIDISGVVIPINYRLPQEELEYIFKDSSPDIVITNSYFLKNFKKMIYCSYLVVIENNEYEIRQFKTFKKYKTLDIEKEVFTLQYTSGTTGLPKGVMLTNKSIIECGKKHIRAWELTKKEVYLSLVPLFFCAPNGLSVALQTAGTMILLENLSPEPKAILSIVEKERVTLILAALPHITKLANFKNVTKYKIESLKLVHCIGSSVPLDILNKFEQNLKVPLSTAYGLVESGYTGTLNNPLDSSRKLETEGRPLPGIKIKIKSGEILIKSPLLMKGYYKKPKDTKRVLRDGWLHTGDIGGIDKDGYLKYIDRKDDMFKVGGIKVYPSQIEKVLLQHPKVKNVAVCGISDRSKGMVPMAWIVVKKNQILDKSDLIEYAKTLLPKYMIPREIKIVDSLPLTASGKIARQELKYES